MLSFLRKNAFLCTRFMRQTDRQTDGQHHRIKIPHVRAGLKHSSRSQLDCAVKSQVVSLDITSETPSHPTIPDCDPGKAASAAFLTACLPTSTRRRFDPPRGWSGRRRRAKKMKARRGATLQDAAGAADKRKRHGTITQRMHSLLAITSHPLARHVNSHFSP